MASNRKNDILELIEHLRDQNFRCEKARNGHWKIVSPTGQSCQIAATPRDQRGVLNAITRLKRIGYKPPSKHV